MNKFVKNIYENKHIILIFTFSLISALCLFMKSDDFLWYYVVKKPELESYRIPNGRYFSNFITYICLQFPILKCIFYTIVLSFIIILIGKIICFQQKKSKIGIIFSFFMVLMIPSETYSEVINWFSGFTNYSFSFLLTSIYILFCFKILFDNYTPKNFLCFIMFILALISGLCIENISIYNIIFSIVVIFLIKDKRKKIYPVNICYTVGAIIGFIIMITNKRYIDIMNKNDSVGARTFNFSLSDIYMTLFRYIIAHYSVEFWLANIIIIVSLLIIYIKSGKSHKYGKLCMMICIGYMTYSIFVSCFVKIESLHDSMKIKSIETAFAFMYFLSLLYLIFKLLEKNSMIRCLIYLLSTLIVSAPFIIVSPFTARCMFANYMFWILLSGELFNIAIKSVSFCKTDFFVNILLIPALMASIIIGGIDITNNYYNTARYEYVREQKEMGQKNINMIRYPYDDYAKDFLSVDNIYNDDTTFNCGTYYEDYIFEYYGIDGLNKDDYIFTAIDSADYNRIMEN